MTDSSNINFNNCDFNQDISVGKNELQANQSLQRIKFLFDEIGDGKIDISDGIDGKEAKLLFEAIGGSDGVLSDKELMKAFGDASGEVSIEDVSAFKKFLSFVAEKFSQTPQGTVTAADNASASGTAPKAGESENECAHKIAADKPGLTQEDDGTYSVVVQKWGSQALEGNDRANDCLDRIMKNYFPDVKPYSAEWRELELQIMNLNPQIYGEEGGKLPRGSRTGARNEAWIYTGEKIKLPSSFTPSQSTTPTTETPSTEPPKTEPPKNEPPKNDPQNDAIERNTNGIPTFLDDYDLFDMAQVRIKNLTDEQLVRLKNGEKVEFEVSNSSGTRTVKCAWQLDENGVLNGYGIDSKGKEQLVWQFKTDGSYSTFEYPNDNMRIEKTFNDRTGEGYWKTFKDGSDVPTSTTYFKKQGKDWVKYVPNETPGTPGDINAASYSSKLNLTADQLKELSEKGTVKVTVNGAEITYKLTASKTIEVYKNVTIGGKIVSKLHNEYKSDGSYVNYSYTSDGQYTEKSYNKDGNLTLERGHYPGGSASYAATYENDGRGGTRISQKNYFAEGSRTPIKREVYSNGQLAHVYNDAVVNSYVNSVNSSSGSDNIASTFATVLNTGKELSPDDLITFLNRVGGKAAQNARNASQSVKNAYVNALNNILKTLQGPALADFLKAYESNTGRSISYEIMMLQSMGTEDTSLKMLYSTLDAAVPASAGAKKNKNTEHIAYIALALDTNNSGGVLKQVLNNVDNDQQSKQEALAVLYHHYGSTDAMFNVLNGMGDKDQEKYGALLVKLFQYVLEGRE